MSSTQVINNPYQPPKRPLLRAGCNGRPKLVMSAADGALAELYLHGARLSSWVPAGGHEWLSQDQAAESVQGGIVLLFPQPDALEFASTMDWNLVRVSQADATVTALLKLSDSRATRRDWRQRFQLGLLVTVGGNQLKLQWHIKNTGRKLLQFSPVVQQQLRLDESSVTTASFQQPACGTSLLLHDGARMLQLSSQDLFALKPFSAYENESNIHLRLATDHGMQALELQRGALWRAELILRADPTPLLVAT